MRKFLIPLLMASVLVPAAASAEDRGFRDHRSESGRDGLSDDLPQRVERAQRAEHSGGGGRAMRIELADRPTRTERGIQQDQSLEPVRHVRRIEREQTVEPVQEMQQVRRVERDQDIPSVRRMRRSQAIDDGVAIRRVPREAQPVAESQVEVRRGGDRDGFAIRRVAREVQPSPGTRIEVRRALDRDGISGQSERTIRDGDRSGSRHHWSGDWRRDDRYDWRGYRNRYGSLYRLGRYNDPYGWNYRRFPIGFNLWPSYYGSRFWLDDPWHFRLPRAYGPYRWVRYYEDALMVNIYTGQVVDVIHNFFW